MKKLLVVVGTRPNFVKVTRFKSVAALRGDMKVELVHTGQHTDARMTDVFFEQFGMQPDHVLTIADGGGASRLGQMLIGLEPLMLRTRPDAVVVVGDVDSTLAGALAANRCGIPLFHVEAGLRNGDMRMPEEVNRILTDRVADHCFTTEPSGAENLLGEGKSQACIHFVGNTMIDTLAHYRDRIDATDVGTTTSGGHALVTIHRPANVDTKEALGRVIEMLAVVASYRPVVFPVHPRTLARLKDFGLDASLRAIAGITILPSADYFTFQKLIASSACVVTDSGGVQEETTYSGVPCLTLRPNTERPITITEGTNELLPFSSAAVRDAMQHIADGTFKKGCVPRGWDGMATERVLDVIARVL
ncbi:MAG TPA: UDP-N-acetylglucosamine 2-epimerase (non-hydrolyzing) [Flavobacteriales bacterium]|nr:UDP-N-acetylglucosamine 2-epimerase (non-hydrolyzing) [Flavobacteriales bacterium]